MQSNTEKETDDYWSLQDILRTEANKNQILVLTKYLKAVTKKILEDTDNYLKVLATDKLLKATDKSYWQNTDKNTRRYWQISKDTNNIKATEKIL
jgi:uncharacterized protein (DUF1499 family)